MRCALVALLLALSATAPVRRASPGLRAPTWTAQELDQATQDFCREHGLHKAAQQPQLFDAFMFNSELDMLEVRLLELYDFVDHFVILEGKRSLQNRPKPLHYAENKQRFARFADKIIHVTLDVDPQDKALYRKWQHKVVEEMAGSAAMAAKAKRYGVLDEPFYREWWQREQLWEQGVVPHAKTGDMVILGDVDEIPRPETLRALRSCPFSARHNCANLDGSYFYYSYSGYAGDWKAGPKVVVYEDERTMEGMDQDGLRFEGNCTLQLPKSSTHCTNCFSTITAFQNKVASFAHWQLNGAPFTEPDYILHKVRSGLAIFDPDEKRGALHPADYCDHAPRAVLENPHALHYMLIRDPKTGSFLDYETHFGSGGQQKGSSFKLTLKRHGDTA